MKPDLPSFSSLLEKAADWVECHPRAVLAGLLVVVTAVMLAQTPAEMAEHDPGSDDSPLFV